MVSRPALILLAMAGALFVIARTSGAGWVMVLVSGLVATLVVATAWPGVLLRTARVSVTAPQDGTVGRPLSLRVDVGGWAQPLKLRAVSPVGSWTGALVPATGEITVVPERRGVVRDVDVELRGAGPLGIVWWKTRARLELEHPIEVGPVPQEPARLPVASAGGVGGDPRAGNGLDVVRGVREYVPGDPARLVHWPVSAHHGSLVVKELEDPASHRLAIVVDLRPPQPLQDSNGGPQTGTTGTNLETWRGSEVEAAASRAAGLAIRALREGFAVTMATAEDDGGRVTAVKTRLDVSRRLARAVDAAPPDGPFPPGTEVVRVTTAEATK
jgi:uncharacterized protein (DUF58 family)